MALFPRGPLELQDGSPIVLKRTSFRGRFSEGCGHRAMFSTGGSVRLCNRPSMEPRDRLVGWAGSLRAARIGSHTYRATSGTAVQSNFHGAMKIVVFPKGSIFGGPQNMPLFCTIGHFRVANHLYQQQNDRRSSGTTRTITGSVCILYLCGFFTVHDNLALELSYVYAHETVLLTSSPAYLVVRLS
jgi:hypothetical protein